MFFNSHVESDKHQQREFDSVRTYIRRITKEVLADKKRKMNGNTSLKIQLHRKLSRVLLSFVSYSVFLYITFDGIGDSVLMLQNYVPSR